ncbi:MAG TPA: hypothetical protein VMW80_11430 [Candidatus Dormibacteraeota bacterium]|nr:hypothetical protein [Candidatus Dormibacteraeota bacterium]
MASSDAASNALPATLRASGSLVAPVLVAYRGVPSVDTILPIVSTAAMAVPKVTTMRKHLVGRKAVTAPHIRDVFYQHKADAPAYKLIARCLDVGPNQTASQAFGTWIWEASFISFKRGQHPGLIPEECEQIRLDVTRYRIQNNGVVGARQLALFRHLFVEGFRSLDPSATVYGGQHDWRPEWWPNPAPPVAQ